MTQHIATEESTSRAWSRIGDDQWSQMAWFVKLANATEFASMSAGEQLLWQEEFVAMELRRHGPVMDVPLDRKRYPRTDIPRRAMIIPPTPVEMQEVRDVIKQPISDLADGRGTRIPECDGFQIAFSVKFMGNPEHFKGPDTEPRYLIEHNEEPKESGPNPSRQIFLLRLIRLFEAYSDKTRHFICADRLRRCPKCKKVFLQVKRSSRYCGPKCYTVEGMRLKRAEQKELLAMKEKTKKKRVRKSTRESKSLRYKLKRSTSQMKK